MDSTNKPVRFIPCNEDEQIYHFHRTTKKAIQRDYNIRDVDGNSLKGPAPKKPIVKSAPGTFKKLKSTPRKPK